MKSTVLALTLCTSVCAAVPKLIFTKSFPGSDPEYVRVDVDRTGALEYKESPKDEQPLKAQLQERDTAMLFSMAEKLSYFKLPLESSMKVANMGKKTFRYEDENGAATEVSFNYSTNETAQQLVQRFEQISASERAYLDLDRAIHLDKLGVNQALAEIESLWLRKELVAPQQFLPNFKRIISHDSFMHLARERAARLKDQFEAASPGTGEPTQK
jgi:hypothetical protein